MDGMTRDYADHRRLERARGRGRASGRRDDDAEDDAAPTSQGVDDVEAEDGEDDGLETQKDAVTEETMPEDAPNGAK